jgi:hypothetical protein
VAEENTNEPQLFDLVIPPGVPRSIIYDIQGKFDLEVVSRRERMQFANMDGDARDLLAFRGKKELIEQAYDYMMAELEKYVEDK